MPNLLLPAISATLRSLWGLSVPLLTSATLACTPSPVLMSADDALVPELSSIPVLDPSLRPQL
jgi:hypothetical protein